MNDATQGNAMTEIALAMAMGFFSVMVLTMISMGVGLGQKRAMDTIILAPPAPQSAAADTVKKDDLLVIYDGGRYLGRTLRPLDAAAIARASRVILALPPDLSMAAAMKARQGIKAKNLVVTTLDRRWRRALEDRQNGRR
ncbi:MAG: hypothetical protein IIC52_05295 [Proteobacteria bacterium]|nr:hypothetical protein [Candidatus Neomarinimicrobiota bacterium]MCH8917452.1 hypothetical protein [Pseudomonadota bacterium]